MLQKEEKEEGEKNTKKIRRTLKAHISGTAWLIQLKFGIGGAPPHEICTENLCFCSGSFEQQMRENSVFFTPVKYTLVCPTPKVPFFLGTTECLDSIKH